VVGSGIGTRNVELERAHQFGVIPRGVRLGTTVNGRRAALKALHPAMEIGAHQWPDRNTADTVVLENLDVIDIPPPPAVEGATMEKWHINIYLMPFPDNVALIARWWDGQDAPDINNVKYNQVRITGQTDLWSTTYTMIYSPPFDVLGEYPGDYFQQVRLVARSATIDLVASGLYDQGTVYGGQFGADIKPLPERAASIENRVLEKMAKVITKAQRLEESEQKYSLPELIRAMKNMDADLGLEVDEADSAFPIDKTGFYTVYQELPNSFAELAQVDKKYYQNDAKFGVYMPLKHSATNDLDLEEAVQQYQLVPIYPGDQPARWGHHVMYGNSWQVGVVMFRNLLKEASLNAKLISDLEATPKATSIMAKLSRPAPALDQMAIDQTQEVMTRLPSAFPSEANTLGTILDQIGKFLAGSGIPLLDKVGQLTQTGVGKQVTGLLDNLL